MKRIQTPNKGKRNIAKRKNLYISFCTFYFLLLTFLPGCGNKFFDPTQIGRFRPTPAVNVILNSLGVAEEAPVAWEGAEEPKPADSMAIESDYRLMPADTVAINIYELFQERVLHTNNYTVTETGKISIPEVGVVQAAGLTETQLEEEIKQILSPNILKDPYVTVTLLNSQQHTFSILGDGVAAPSRYVIPRYDFRLTDALATAGGPRQFNVSYIYVSRKVGKTTSMTTVPLELGVIEPEFPEIKMIQPEFPGLEEPEMLFEPQPELREVITPLAHRHYKWPESKVVIASTELATVKEYAQAGWQKGFETSPSFKQSWEDIEKAPQPTPQLAGPEGTQESVSIKDILKTLSERNHQNRVYERADVQDVTKSLAEPRIEKPIDVEEVLRSFSEPTTDMAEEPIDIEERLKSFTEPEERLKKELDSTIRPDIAETLQERIDKGEAGRIEWIFQDGKWIPVQVGPPLEPEPIEPIIEFEPKPTVPTRVMVMPRYEQAKEKQMRVIKIPIDKLLAGDPRYNIVIKPGDSIFVPVDIVGEFCIMGNVNAQGYIPLTGRPLTLKMAIAAAGGLGPLAWPKRCEVIRRISKDKEEIVMVDLDKIASGEQPDFFIKPNDLINVGTHATSTWRAVLRNAFRATYGFGFVYDRNFADIDYGYKGLSRWF